MGTYKRNKNFIRPHSSAVALKYFAEENIPCDHNVLLISLTRCLSNSFVPCKVPFSCEIWDSHGGISEGSSLLGCYAV